MRTTCLVVLVLLTISACSAAALDPARPSAIERLPLPAAAEPYGSEGLFRAEYRVPGIAFGALIDWYDRQLPDGQRWGDWSWCSGLRPGAGRDAFMQKTYSSPSKPQLILSVLVSDGRPPTVLIGRDESGPCR